MMLIRGPVLIRENTVSKMTFKCFRSSTTMQKIKKNLTSQFCQIKVADTWTDRPTGLQAEGQTAGYEF